MFANYKNRWWIVLAAMSGLMVGSGCINVFVFAVFLKPVSLDLDVSRADLSSGLAMAMLLCSIASPVTGSLSDRWGARRVLLVGIPLYTMTIAAFALMKGSLVSIFLLFALAGVIGTTQNTVPYAKVVSTWFDRERGLALGIATSGMGLGVAVVPALANLYIQWAGWRLAYVALAVTIVLFSFIPALLFVGEPVPTPSGPGRSLARTAKLMGLTLKEAVRSWRFWALSVAFLVGTACINGTLIDVVAMLTDRGMTTGQAVAAFSAAGIAMIVGRVVCGWALDRFSGSVVAISIYAAASSGIVILASSAGDTVPMVGTVLCGFGLGGVINLVTFFAGRYFGLLAYGSVFGALFGLILLGSGLGPYLNALSLEYTHNYTPMLIVFAIILLAVSLLFIPLGPYPYAARPAPTVPAEAAAFQQAVPVVVVGPNSAKQVVGEMQRQLSELEVLAKHLRKEIADLRERHQLAVLYIISLLERSGQFYATDRKDR